MITYTIKNEGDYAVCNTISIEEALDFLLTKLNYNIEISRSA